MQSCPSPVAYAVTVGHHRTYHKSFWHSLGASVLKGCECLTGLAITSGERKSSRNSEAGSHSYEQMVTRSGAGNIEQVPLGVVDFCKSHHRDRFDRSQRDDLIVTSDYSHSTEFKPLGQMHRADRDVTAMVSTFSSRTLNVGRILDRIAGSRQFGRERTKIPNSCGTSVLDTSRYPTLTASISSPSS